MSRPQSARFARHTMYGNEPMDIVAIQHQLGEKRMARIAEQEKAAAEKAQEDYHARAVEEMATTVAVARKFAQQDMAETWREQMSMKPMRANWDLEDPTRLRQQRLPRNPAPAWQTGDMGRPSSAQTFRSELREDPRIKAAAISSMRHGVAVSMAEKEVKALAAAEAEAVAAAAQETMRGAIGSMEAGIVQARRDMARANRDDNAFLLDMKRQHEAAVRAAEEAARLKKEAEDKAYDESLLARIAAQKEEYARETALAHGRPGTAPLLYDMSRRAGMSMSMGMGGSWAMGGTQSMSSSTASANARPGSASIRLPPGLPPASASAVGNLTQSVQRAIYSDEIAAQCEERGMKTMSKREEKGAADATVMRLGQTAVQMEQDVQGQRADFLQRYYAQVAQQAEYQRAKREAEKAMDRMPQAPANSGLLAGFGRSLR